LTSTARASFHAPPSQSRRPGCWPACRRGRTSIEIASIDGAAPRCARRSLPRTAQGRSIGRNTCTSSRPCSSRICEAASCACRRRRASSARITPGSSSGSIGMGLHMTASVRGCGPVVRIPGGAVIPAGGSLSARILRRLEQAVNVFRLERRYKTLDTYASSTSDDVPDEGVVGELSDPPERTLMRHSACGCRPATCGQHAAHDVTPLADPRHLG
jgi:hypothetical protein